MFRKLTLSAILAVATLTYLIAAPSAADAAPTILPHHHFEVVVERGGAWQSRGVYHLQVRAEMLAARLRHQGYRVEIRQF
jgi:hypothetical protein